MQVQSPRFILLLRVEVGCDPHLGTIECSITARPSCTLPGTYATTSADAFLPRTGRADERRRRAGSDSFGLPRLRRYRADSLREFPGRVQVHPHRPAERPRRDLCLRAAGG